MRKDILMNTFISFVCKKRIQKISVAVIFHVIEHIFMDKYVILRLIYKAYINNKLKHCND